MPFVANNNSHLHANVALGILSWNVIEHLLAVALIASLTDC